MLRKNTLDVLLCEWSAKDSEQGKRRREKDSSKRDREGDGSSFGDIGTVKQTGRLRFSGLKTIVKEARMRWFRRVNILDNGCSM